MTVDKKIFGGSSINYECYLKILELLPKGSTILEFGSGRTSDALRETYTVYSVEHDGAWVKGPYKEFYIHAPLVEHEGLEYDWYNVDILKENLPSKYDMILVDGPPANKKRTARHGFLKYLDIFDLENTIIVFHDIHRKHDFDHMVMVAEKLGKEYHTFEDSNMHGVIL